MHPPSLHPSPHTITPSLPPPPPSTVPFLQDPSLSTYLKVRISCILIGMSIFLSPSSLLLFFDFGSVASFKQTTTTTTTEPPPPPSPTLPSPLFLNQYLPSANKSYNFLTVRRVRRRHIYLQLVSLFSAVDPSFWRRGY